MARLNRIAILLILIASVALPVMAQDATATPEPVTTTDPAATTEPVATTDPAATTEPAATTDPAATADPAATTEPAEEEPTFIVTAPEVTAVDSLAFVVFAHTSVDSGPVDFYIEALGAEPVVANLAFGEATDIVNLPAGTHTVNVRAAGSAADSEPLATFTWDFTGNSTWIVSAVGLMETVSFLAEPVTVIRTPLNGLARVRIANWVSDIEMLNVDSDSDTVFAEGLGWAGIQDVEIEPGTYQLQVTDGADADFTEPVSFDFEADTVYVVFLTGSTTMGPAVDYLVIEMPQDETRVQFVNERSDTIDIHLRPGDELIAGGLEAGATSEWFSIPSTAATFIAYAPGTGPTGQELASLASQLRPARDVTVVFHDDGTTEITSETLTPADVEDEDDAEG
jgi:hypothetical protein